MKYNVYFELKPILIENVEAPNEEVAEDIAFNEILKHIKVDFVETTEDN